MMKPEEGLECPNSANCQNNGTISEHAGDQSCRDGQCINCPVPVQCEFCWTEPKSKFNIALRDAGVEGL